jgi:hypothetical protein
LTLVASAVLTYSWVSPQEVTQPAFIFCCSALSVENDLIFSGEVKNYATELQWIQTMKHFG